MMRTARRAVVVAATLLASAAIVLLPHGGQLASATAAQGVPAHGDREPAGTRIDRVDGTGIVSQYGQVVPSFDGWDQREPTRDYQTLDGEWRFRFDPNDQGLAAGWQQPSTDTSGWDTITVPSSWDLQDTPGFGSYDGSLFGSGTAFRDGYAWYRTTTVVPGTGQSRQMRLNFLAVNYRGDVWVDGTFVGTHEGGQTPFALSLGDALRPGHEAVIAVRVHRRASFTDYTTVSAPVTDPLAVPWKPVDYWPYAGITRSVWLESVPRVNIPKILIAAQDGQLDARVIVANQSQRDFHGQVLIRPGEGSGAQPVSVPVSVRAGQVAVARAQVAIPDAPQWSPAHPNMLTAVAELRKTPEPAENPLIDQLSSTYGVRSVGTDGSTLTVNGTPVFLKGLNWHEETAAHGRSMTLAEYDHELGHAINTGANLLRNSVYNRHPYVYEWTDSHGVFVMDDTDNMWLNTAQEQAQTNTYGLSRAMAVMMAWNQHNRPSVVLWGLQNESEIDGAVAPVYRRWLQDMKDAIKAVDLQNRPVTWASNTTRDPAFDIADVIGFNEYFGYFYGKNSDLGPAIDAVHAQHPGQPILITENGSWSFPGHHGPQTEQGTEEWQAANFDSHWQQVIERSDYVAGYAYWVLKDYKERLGYNQQLNGISVMGMLGFDSVTRRLVYDAFANARTPR